MEPSPGELSAAAAAVVVVVDLRTSNVTATPCCFKRFIFEGSR